MRIAFLVGVFRRVSETFVLNQIVGLMENGHEVDFFAGKNGPLKNIPADIDRLDLLKRTAFSNHWLNPRALLAGLNFPRSFISRARYGRPMGLSGIPARAREYAGAEALRPPPRAFRHQRCEGCGAA